MAILDFSQKYLLVTHSIFLFSEVLLIHLCRILFMSFQTQRGEHGSQHVEEEILLVYKTSQWAVVVGTLFSAFRLIQQLAWNPYMYLLTIPGCLISTVPVLKGDIFFWVIERLQSKF